MTDAVDGVIVQIIDHTLDHAPGFIRPGHIRIARQHRLLRA